MNRFLSFLLTLTFLAVLTSCGKDKKTSETPTTVTSRQSQPFSGSAPKSDLMPDSVKKPESVAPDCEKNPEDPACGVKKNPVQPQPEQKEKPPEQKREPLVQQPEPPKNPVDSGPRLEEPKKEPPVPLPVGPAVDASLEFAQNAAKTVEITCKNGDCNPSVAMLTFVAKEAVGWGANRCSASLIAPDLMVSNAHCVPEDLKEAGSACGDRIWFTFPGDKDHPNYDRQARCAKVLFRKIEEYGYEGYDLAYFQLEKPVNRPSIRTSREGFVHGDTYEVNKLNPVRSEKVMMMTGEFERVSCKAVLDSRIFEGHLRGHDQGVLLADCPIIKGNSGSAVIANDGTMRGVIYGQIDIPRLRNIFNRYGSVVPAERDIALLSLATNFACLPDPSDLEGKSLPQKCEGLDAQRRKVRGEFVAKTAIQLRASAQKMITEQSKDRSEISAFGWAPVVFSTSMQGINAIGAPICAHFEKAEVLAAKTRQINRPKFYVRAQYDAYFHEANPELVWAGWNEPTDFLELVKSGPGYSTKITNSKSGQPEFVGLLKSCK